MDLAGNICDRSGGRAMNGVAGVLDESGKIHDHCFQIGDQSSPPAPARRQDPPQVAAPVAPQTTTTAAPAVELTAKKASAQPLTTRRLLADLKARLRVVEREIKARKTLEKERDQIQRLIAAANNELDNLRRIRAAG